MSNVKSMRAILALLAATLVSVVAGCGDSGGAGAAASAVPEDVAVYVSVDTSFEGDQWRTVADLLAKFPDGEGALEELLDDAASEAGLEGGADLRGALGPEVAIAVLAGPPSPNGEPPVVLLTQPENEDAWERLFEDEDAARAEVRGWQAVAQDEDVLDRYRDALEDGTLDDSEGFVEAMDDLPEGSLARLYANGESLVQAVPELGAGMQQFPFGAAAGGADALIGAALRAEENGVRIEGRALSTAEDTLPGSDPYESELVEEVPAGAVAFLSFNNPGAALTEYAGMLGGAQSAFLPFDLGQVSTLLSGETAVYVRPGPTVTLVTEVEDEAAALETVEALLGLGGEQVPIVYDAFDGFLVVSSSRKELEAFRGDGPRLDQDDRFEKAVAEAGMPAATTGFGYVDVQGVVPIFLGLMPPEGVELEAEAAEALEYLEPLGGAVFWGEHSGDAQRFSLFLSID
jgi:hypothetical protein